MRQTLPQEKVDAAAMQAMTTYHSDVVNEVQEAVRTNRICVVGMAGNVFVKKAKGALAEKKIAFKYLEYGSYVKGWQKRLAIKLWSGWPTYPQVFIDGKLIGGFTELKAWLAKNN
jgi:glutaredoxin-related protein